MAPALDRALFRLRVVGGERVPATGPTDRPKATRTRTRARGRGTRRPVRAGAVGDPAARSAVRAAAEQLRLAHPSHLLATEGRTDPSGATRPHRPSPGLRKPA